MIPLAPADLWDVLPGITDSACSLPDGDLDRDTFDLAIAKAAAEGVADADTGATFIAMAAFARSVVARRVVRGSGPDRRSGRDRRGEAHRQAS